MTDTHVTAPTKFVEANGIRFAHGGVSARPGRGQGVLGTASHAEKRRRSSELSADDGSAAGGTQEIAGSAR